MRTRAVLSGIFASTSILVVGWQIGVTEHAASVSVLPPTSSGTLPRTTTTATPNAPASAAPSVAATPAPAAPTSKDGTFTGASVQTPFGSVQVQITVSGGTITDVTALRLTDSGGRSVQISNDASPVLQSEVLASQSAKVSNVSGATYTSQAYLQSVQSALDKAGL